jgi:hypothetical protein
VAPILRIAGIPCFTGIFPGGCCITCHATRIAFGWSVGNKGG